MKSALLCSILALGLSASQAIGSIELNNSPQPGNQGQGTIESWLSGIITTYNGVNEPDLPAPGSQVFRVNKTGGSPDTPPPAYSSFPVFGEDKLSIEVPTSGFNYIVLHWGGQGGGTTEAFYIGDETNPLVFGAPGKNGLSSYSLFGTRTTTVVPEPSTYIAGGLALVPLLFGLRSRLAKKA